MTVLRREETQSSIADSENSVSCRIAPARGLLYVPAFIRPLELIWLLFLSLLAAVRFRLFCQMRLFVEHSPDKADQFSGYSRYHLVTRLAFLVVHFCVFTM